MREQVQFWELFSEGHELCMAHGGLNFGGYMYSVFVEVSYDGIHAKTHRLSCYNFSSSGSGARL